MAHEANAPVSGSERLGELDIIRGVALLGVLWMNLAAHGELALPATSQDVRKPIRRSAG